MTTISPICENRFPNTHFPPLEDSSGQQDRQTETPHTHNVFKFEKITVKLFVVRQI